MRKLLLWVWAMLLAFLSGLVTYPVRANHDSAPTDYPTLIALEQTVVPIADPTDLARRLRDVEVIPAPLTTAPARNLGDHERFRVNNSDADYSFDVDATLRAIGEHIYLWVQEGVDIPTTELEELAYAWDNRIYNQTRELWGSETIPGIDGEVRAHMLFAYDMGFGVAGYFSRMHTYPREVFPDSNEHEMFFMSLDAFLYEMTGAYIEGVMAHEFQHMIRDSIDVNEDAWLGEGFSTFTELHLGYDSPLWFGEAFLLLPGTQLNSFALESFDRTPNYGAAFLFVTYFYERYGLAGIQLWSADTDNGLTSVDNTLSKLNAPGIDVFFADWVLANWVQDTSVEDGQYGYTLLEFPYRPASQMEISHYPYAVQNTAAQYSAAYYELSDLSGIDNLTFSLEIPKTVSLIPTEAASGNRMWYSNRGDVSNMTLTHSFDLSNVESATLRYKAWYEIEENWDYAYVEVSADGGAHWTVLATPNSTDNDPFRVAYGPGYTGDSGGWIEQGVSLDAFAGQEIFVRFEMITDDAINLPGLAIDDVTIPEIGYTSDFEADNGGWLAEGWLWMDNVLPQQAWLQVIQYAGEGVIAITRWYIPDNSMDSTQTLPLQGQVDQVVVVVSPFAPVTTVSTTYTLSIAKSE